MEDCFSVCMCMCLREMALIQYSLSQSNKGENCDVVAHTNDEDEPQGEGEILHVCQLNHLT